MLFIKKYLFSIILGCVTTGLPAQTFNGKSLLWKMDNNPEKDVEIKYGTTGLNPGGFDGTSVVIKNNSSDQVSVRLKLNIRDVCGEVSSRTFDLSVKPNSTLGGNTWFGGMEQFDFNPKCKEVKTYEKNFKTRIADVQFELLSLVKKNTSGDEYSETIRGVTFKIKKVKKSDKSSLMFVTVINNNQEKDMAMAISIMADGKTIYEPSPLHSGQTLNLNLGNAQSIEYLVLYRVYDQEDQGLIDWLKKLIKKEVTTPPEGAEMKRKKISTTCMCIRG